MTLISKLNPSVQRSQQRERRGI